MKSSDCVTASDAATTKAASPNTPKKLKTLFMGCGTLLKEAEQERKKMMKKPTTTNGQTDKNVREHWQRWMWHGRFTPHRETSEFESHQLSR